MLAMVKILRNNFKILKGVSVLLFFSLFTIFLFSLVFAEYGDFLKTLKQNGFAPQEIVQRESISRYELTSLLNASECKNCIVPSQQYFSSYTADFWQKFTKTPWNYFSDIAFNHADFLDTNYFYCVAYVGDHHYMQGYSQYTSPICWGKFCGTKNVSNAEFYQVLVNLLAKYIYQDFSVNWEKVAQWYLSLEDGSYQKLSFSRKDLAIIEKYAKEKKGNAPLQSPESLKTYARYCSFNLESCWFTSINDIEQGFWPIAEINILLKKKVLVASEISKSKLFKSPTGKEVLQAIYPVNGLTQCVFDSDYDFDKIPNESDNCPTSFNPHQRDSDGDGIGDVCDDDIDNDGIKNPIGIVDDSWEINIWVLDDAKKKRDDIDNCIFVKNKDQKDLNQDTVWDVCENTDGLNGNNGNDDDLLWITIKTNAIESFAPANSSFTAVVDGKWNRIDWKFSDDGTTPTGETVKHLFLEKGLYTITAIASNSTHKARATTQVYVWENSDVQNAIQVIDPVLIYPTTKKVKIILQQVGDIDKIIVYFWDKKKEYPSWTRIIDHDFSWESDGEKKIVVQLVKWGKIVWVSQTVSWVWKWTVGASLRATTLTPIKGDEVGFSTKIKGFKYKDIKEIIWDFWDGKKIRNKNIVQKHVYNTVGAKLVKQKIVLHDGRVVEVVITVHVVDPKLSRSYFLNQSLKKLIWKVEDLVRINYIKARNQKEEDIVINNGNWQKGYKKLPIFVEDKYYIWWEYKPWVRGWVAEHSIKLISTSTIQVLPDSRCHLAYKNWTLKKFRCDFDKDWIPDICDDDIDNDGKKNSLDLIKKENDDCSFNDDNVNRDILDDNWDYSWWLDNCPFKKNKEQKDKNNDWIGDVCQKDTEEILWDNLKGKEDKDWDKEDRDGDWIDDESDNCPNLPENYNGIVDWDWCPELIDDWWASDHNTWDKYDKDGDGVDDSIDDYIGGPIISPSVCNSCPCAFSDFAYDLAEYDKVKIELKNKIKTKLYDYVPSVPVSDFR